MIKAITLLPRQIALPRFEFPAFLRHLKDDAVSQMRSPLGGAGQIGSALGVGRGAGFAPTDIVGLRIWLKADALGLNNDDPVVTWTDQSGNGTNVTQGTANKRPLYKTGIQNGLPAILFDGANDSLRNAAAPTRTQPFTVYVVVKRGAVGAYLVANGATGNEWAVLSGATASIYAGTTLVGNANAAGTPYILRGVFNGASSSIRVNNDAAVVGAAGASADAGITIGSNYNMGGGFSGSYLCEVLEYAGAISGSNDTNIMSYLNGKWSVY